MFALMAFLLKLIPCQHLRETWPRRRVKSNEASRRVCLDCGRERRYALLDFHEVPRVRTRQAC